MIKQRRTIANYLDVAPTRTVLHYKYMVQSEGENWTAISDYNISKSYEWTPTKAGIYTVRTLVTNGAAKAKKDSIITVVSDKAPVISSFTASNTSIALGTSITLETTATGSELKYKYMVQLDGIWTTIRMPNEKSSYEWTPETTGVYIVRVVVTDGTNEVRKDISITVTSESAPEISLLTANSTNIELGESIVFETTATGTNLQYKYLAQSNGTFNTIRALSSESSYEWTPLEAGTYVIRVVVSNGLADARKDISVEVTSNSELDTIIISEFNPDNTVQLNTSITLETTATVVTKRVNGFAFMGAGFKSLEESPKAQTKSRKYINDKSTTQSINGYSWSTPFELDQIREQEAVDFICKIGELQLVGEDTERDFVMVDLDKKTSDKDIYYARKIKVAVELSNFSNDDGDLGASGNLLGIGDIVEGYFNVAEREFLLELGE